MFWIPDQGGLTNQVCPSDLVCKISHDGWLGGWGFYSSNFHLYIDLGLNNISCDYIMQLYAVLKDFESLL